MALQLALEHEGQTYPAAYIRVAHVNLDARDIWVTVAYYADEAARFSKANPVKLFTFMSRTHLLTGDIYPAAYSYIKRLPEFAGAVDVQTDSEPEPVPVYPWDPQPAPAPEPAPEPQPTQAPAEA